MKEFAVFADCHGNTLALEAVLADIDRRGVSSVINLVGYCGLRRNARSDSDPAGVAALLMARDIPSLAGNSETYAPGDLTDEQVSWIEARPKTLEFGDIYCCHGTPVSDHEELIEDITRPHVGLAPADVIRSRLAGIRHSLVLCGHKHVPRLVRLPSGEIIVNPGSVGWPAYWNDEPSLHIVEAGSPHARYAVLTKTNAGWLVEHIAVPYDWETAAKTAAAKGNNERAEAIRTGRMSFPLHDNQPDTK